MSRTNSKSQIILLVVISLILVTVLLLNRFLQSSISQQERVEKILNKYIEQEIIASDFLNDKTITLSHTENTFPFTAGGSIEEFFSQLETINPDNDNFYEVNLISVISAAISMLIGVIFGCLFRQLRAKKGQIKIFDEISQVFSSSSFWSAIAASPIVFFAIFAVSGDNPEGLSNYALAFQNGFLCESVLRDMFPNV